LTISEKGSRSMSVTGGTGGADDISLDANTA
jgi:hypothetical protein